MRSCKKYLLLLGLLLMAAVGGCGGIGYEETDESRLRLKDRKACLLILKY